MQCVNPDNYKKDGTLSPHIPPCGKCLACKLQKQSEWASRLLLESKCHDSATFWTLTYSEEHCPSELSKRDMQLFIKRWNNNYGKQPRYFLCGEYGDLYERPHYHGISFGDKPEFEWRHGLHAGVSTLVKVDERYEDTWGKGITHVKASDSSTQTRNIMQYVAAYVVKKNIKPTSKPEWSLQSRSPYIGQPAISKIVDALTTRNGSAHLAVVGTCPNFFSMGGKRWMIPLRMRKEVCSALDIEFRPYAATENTVEVDIDGQKTLRAKHVRKKTLAEALHWEKNIRRVFARKKQRAKQVSRDPAATA